MAELLRMPEVAAAATSAVLSVWPLTEGTTFGKGDVVVVVETEKAEVEVPADADGILLKTLVPAGVEVEVGMPIALLGRVGEAVPDLDALLAQLGVPQSSVASPAMAVRRDLPDSTVPDSTVLENEASGEGGPESTRSAPVTPGRGGRVFASPLARRLAREAGLLMGDIAGSGRGRCGGAHRRRSGGGRCLRHGRTGHHHGPVRRSPAVPGRRGSRSGQLVRGHSALQDAPDDRGPADREQAERAALLSAGDLSRRRVARVP
jgi:pyruvate/2-oxoglutarate dehydrogenase complex dihydrolipoamide acyltransferase (E2) component